LGLGKLVGNLQKYLGKSGIFNTNLKKGRPEKGMISLINHDEPGEPEKNRRPDPVVFSKPVPQSTMIQKLPTVGG